MSFTALVRKDARILLRNRALLVALLLYPLLLAGVLGAAFQEPPTRLSLAVLNDDRAGGNLVVGGETITSATLVDAARAFADVTEVRSEADAIAAVRRGDVDAALLIPRGFVGDLSRLGGNATLRVVVDESDPVRAGVARAAVVGGIDAFVKDVVQRKVADVRALLDLTVSGGTTQVAFLQVDVLGIERASQHLRDALATMDADSDEARKVRDVLDFLSFAQSVLGNSDAILTTTAIPVDVQASGLASEDTRLVAVALPGAIVLGVFWTGALAAALLAARERETGAARRLAAAPLWRGESAASKTLVALVAALIPALLVLAIGVAAMGAVVRDPLLAAATLALASLAAAALGGLCAAIARASGGAALLVVLALVPMLLLGGLFYPVAYMPDAAQAVARVLPVTLATDALRGAMLRGSALADLALALAGLAAFALVAGSFGAFVARRRA